MKILNLIIFFSIINSVNVYAQGSPRDTLPFPKDSALLNYKDSILIGKYFVAVKGQFYTTNYPIPPANGKVFVKGYENSTTISLTHLKENFRLQSSDPTHTVLNGAIAFLKTKNISESSIFHIRVYKLKIIPGIEKLEEGDYIAFVGMVTHDQNGTYTFPCT